MKLDGDQTWREQITESQRTCLRLVGEGKSSKEIAIQMGLSHGTVDQYIARAMRTLGVKSRYQAAKTLAEWEAAPVQDFELRSEALAESAFSDEPMDVGNSDGPNRKLASFWHWVPPIGGKRHDMNATETTRDIFLVAVLAIGAVAGIVSILFGLNAYFS